jgi:hypothetical protein
VAGEGVKRLTLRQVHDQLMGDGDFQFNFPAMVPPKPTHPPSWLMALGRFLARAFEAALPVLKYVVIAGVAIALLAVVFLILREVLGVRLGGRRKPATRTRPADWRPDAWKARALLEDADTLAALGRYDEAVRLILHRGIDEIEGRRPRLVRPAYTARDIAALEDVPAAARQAFERIVRIVERSLFGGVAVGQEAFAACRQAYEDFAFPQAWA